MVEVEMFKVQCADGAVQRFKALRAFNGSMRLRRGSKVHSPFYYVSALSGRAQNPTGVQGVNLFVAAFCGILLQRTLHADLPGVDTLVLQVEGGNEFHHVVDGHAITQHSRDELGIVPVLLVEFL